MNFTDGARQARPLSTRVPVRVCYITSVLDNEHAGTEGHLLRLVRGLDRRRFDPQLLVLHRSEFIDAWHDPAVRVRSLGFRALYRPGDWLATWRLAKELKREQIQIVELHSPEAQFVGAAAAAMARVPVVIASRRNLGYESTLKSRFQTGLTRCAIQCFLANSNSVIDRISEMEGIPKRRFRLIYNGVDLPRFDQEATLSLCDAFRAAREDSLMVSIVANLRRVKNLAMFLRAASRVLDVRDGLYFALYGAGPEAAALESLARDLKIEDRVLFLGPRVPIAPYLKASHIGCLTSDSEGFSNSLLEYMAAGLPVVATNVGGAAEAVEDGTTGYLVPAGDDEAMSRRLLELVDNPSLRQRMGQLGRRRVENYFSIDRQLREYESLYQELLDAR